MKNTLILDSGTKRPSFFGFDVMITPLLVKTVFIVGLIACLAVGTVLVVRDGNYLAGLSLAVVGPVALRVWCEAVIVRFKMLEYLRNLSR